MNRRDFTPDDASAAGAGGAPNQAGGLTTSVRTTQLVEHFFRHETGRLHGALVRMLGVQHLALAEDVAQEALLRAMHSWAIGGIPANPSAWDHKCGDELGPRCDASPENGAGQTAEHHPASRASRP